MTLLGVSSLTGMLFYLRVGGFHMVLIEYVFQILHWYIKMPAKSLAVLCGADCFHLWALQMCSCLLLGVLMFLSCGPVR